MTHRHERASDFFSLANDGYSDASRADEVSATGVVVLCAFGMSRNWPRTHPH